MRRVWDPFEFANQADPAALSDSVLAIEEWRANALAYFQSADGLDPIQLQGSIAGIHLQAQLRHAVSAFTLAQPPELGGMVANATLTALAHCAALVLAEGEARGFPREPGIQIMLERINGVIDDELDREGGRDAG